MSFARNFCRMLVILDTDRVWVKDQLAQLAKEIKIRELNERNNTLKS